MPSPRLATRIAQIEERLTQEILTDDLCELLIEELMHLKKFVTK